MGRCQTMMHLSSDSIFISLLLTNNIYGLVAAGTNRDHLSKPRQIMSTWIKNGNYSACTTNTSLPLYHIAMLMYIIILFPLYTKWHSKDSTRVHDWMQRPNYHSDPTHLFIWLRPSDAYMRRLSTHHWFKYRFVAWSAASHYLNQCCNIVHWTIRNKLWNFNRN